MSGAPYQDSEGPAQWEGQLCNEIQLAALTLTLILSVLDHVQGRSFNLLTRRRMSKLRALG
jgi:hypothetical protein